MSKTEKKSELGITTVEIFTDDLKLLHALKEKIKMADLKSTLHWILAKRLPNCEDLAQMLWDSAEKPEQPEKYVFEIKGLGKEGKKEARLLGRVEND